MTATLAVGPFTCDVTLQVIRAPKFDREERERVTYLVGRDYELAYDTVLRFAGGEVLPDCNRALALDPSNTRALYDRGTIHVATKQYDKAIADLSAAVAQAPRFGDAYGNRAVAYYGKGDHERAWQDVHKAQQLGYEVPASFLDKLRRASGRSR